MSDFLSHYRLVLAYGALTIGLLLGLYRIETLAVRNCNSIEGLKANVRQEAIEEGDEAIRTYEDLDQTLALLELARTQEIEEAALRRRDRELAKRDRKLERFAARECT